MPDIPKPVVLVGAEVPPIPGAKPDAGTVAVGVPKLKLDNPALVAAAVPDVIPGALVLAIPKLMLLDVGATEAVAGDSKLKPRDDGVLRAPRLEAVLEGAGGRNPETVAEPLKGTPKAKPPVRAVVPVEEGGLAV